MIVHHSLTRRKACQACVTSKRRCDLVLPRCGTCRKRALKCEYVRGRNYEEAEASNPLSQSHEPVKFVSSAKVSPVEIISSTIDLTTTLKLPASEAQFNIAVNLNTAFSISPRFVPSALHRSYMAKYLQSNISSLALQNRTFFIHHSTLIPPIPSPLQAALSVSALAVLSSPSTFNILDSNLNTLLTKSSQTFYSPLSILYSVQALIVYQLIRLFSPNSNAQQQFHAETTFPLLNKWTIALQTAYFELSPTTNAFQEWILKESFRRTILTSVFLRSYYCAERDGYTELVPLLASLPVTNKGWMWELSVEELDEDLGISVDGEVGTYWDFIVSIFLGCGHIAKTDADLFLSRCKHGIGAPIGMGNFERLLLCLEEDGEVGEATLELVQGVKASGCGKVENIQTWLWDPDW